MCSAVVDVVIIIIIIIIIHSFIHSFIHLHDGEQLIVLNLFHTHINGVTVYRVL